MYKFKQIFLLDLMNLLTNISWVTYSVVLPLGLVLILGFLGESDFSKTVSSYDYYGVATMIYAIFLNASTIAANSFMEERIKSANMRIVHSPLRHFNIHFSKVLSSFVFCAITSGFTILILKLFFGVNYGGSNSWAVFVVWLLTILLFCCLGVMLCCLFKNESTTNNILSLVVTLFAFMGGIFFQVDGLGKLLVAVSWLSPAKWIFVSCLQIIYDGDFSLFLPTCLGLTLLSLLAIFLSKRFFKGEDYI